MTTLIVPPMEEAPWPTLGPGVCAFIEEYLIYGPGDLRGKPYVLDDETRGLIYRMYEVYPRGHAMEGRRRFKEVGISMPKGTAKTEKAALIAAVELHPDGPVRTVGWGVRGDPGVPVGGGVNDPYIPMVAYTEEQTEELAYGALYVMISEGPLADDFDIGLARIMRLQGGGKAEALANAPDSADGMRTTFQHLDETHRFILPRMKAAVQTMKRNIPKRYAADAWTLETTTAFASGEGSVAEATMDYAKAVASGEIKDSRLFYFHRQAREDFDLAKCDLSTDAGPEMLRQAITDARGPSSAWADIESIVAQFMDPGADTEYLQRVWLNLSRKGAGKAFDIETWKALARDRKPKRGALITIGFDGARYFDSTALIATEIASGWQWPLGIWERPEHRADWEVPEGDVDAVLTQAFETFDVWRMYADPPFWESTLAMWAGRWGLDKVWKWPTNRWSVMGPSVRSYANAIAAGQVTHNGDEAFARHIANAVKRPLSIRDAEGVPFWVIEKERKGSPFKIDAAVAGILSWEARTLAISEGIKKEQSPYAHRGIISI